MSERKKGCFALVRAHRCWFPILFPTGSLIENVLRHYYRLIQERCLCETNVGIKRQPHAITKHAGSFMHTLEQPG